MTLDIRTLIIHFMISNLLIALLFGIAFRGRQDRYATLWVASLLVQTLGWGLITMHGRIPDFFSVVVGAGVVGLSYAMITHALANFYRISLRFFWPYWPVPLLISALLAFYPNWEAGVFMPNIVAGLIYSIQMLMGAALLFSRRDRWWGLRIIMGSSALVMMGLMLLRAVIAWRTPSAIIQILETNTVQSLTFLTGSVTRISFSFGFLLLIEARRHDEIHRLATRDPLTGAYNRRIFLELAERELSRCQRHRLPLALMFLDLDHFKTINDSWGHLAGDEVLVQIKALAETCLRRHDIFARYGGEEFCILAPECDLAGALALAERVRHEIETCRIDLQNGAPPFSITASIGVVSVKPAETAVSIGELVSHADRALYRAKRGGRNRVEAGID